METGAEQELRVISCEKDFICCYRVWKQWKGTTSQGMWAASKAGKDKETDYSSEPPERNAALPTLWF